MEGFNIEKPKGRRVAAYGILLTSLMTIILFGGALYLWYLGLDVVNPSLDPVSPQKLNQELSSIDRFSSEKEFQEWLEQADNLSYSSFSVPNVSLRESAAVESSSIDYFNSSKTTNLVSDQVLGTGGEVLADRFSGTNVQVMGIDEPDILKTNGREIYYVPQLGGIRPFYEPVSFSGRDEKLIAPYYEDFNIQTVKAWPVEDLAVVSEINDNGNLLLSDKHLLVLASDGIRTYDVDDPTQSNLVWDISYKSGNWLVDARLKDNQLYLILAGGIDRHRPCPYSPVSGSVGEINIDCRDIWHPVTPVPSDITYTVLKVDVATGSINKTASFVASQGSSTVYMSVDNIYLTHTLPANSFSFVFGFLDDNADIVPAYVLERLNRVVGYDLSEESKSAELRSVLSRWFQSLDQDEALRLVNEMDNRIGEYLKDHRRDLQHTEIVRLDTERLEIQASGSVAGTLLNQFSLDEHNGYLRLATTSGEVGSIFWQYGFGAGRSESVNDLYVLDSGLVKVGEVLGLGVDESIYAVRFVGDSGYLVTFRQTDPFYVIDLTNPRHPQLKGELKIPGYSSYLHPLQDNLILGVGQEDNRVKISLFDVSNASSPKELDKYSLSEYWSDVLETHHAFLLDSKHEIFFLPGGDGGYVMSYSDNSLKLVKAVSGIRARRAVYLEDYLYVAGDDRLVVLDMDDWRRVDEVVFR